MKMHRKKTAGEEGVTADVVRHIPKRDEKALLLGQGIDGGDLLCTDHTKEISGLVWNPIES